MLRLVVTASAILAAQGAAVAHAGAIVPSTPDIVRAGADCHHSMTPECVAKLVVAHTGKPVSPPVSHDGPSRAPAPSCYYDAPMTYVLMPPQPGATKGTMSVQLERCPAGGQPVGPPVLFSPVASSSGTADLHALLDQATKAMSIPPPQVSLAPSATSTQFVGLPMWAWTDRSGWAPKTATVSAGGVSLSMTATPMYSVWSMGDGGSMVCRGPGTPYPAASAVKAPRKSPDCGYAYSVPSTSRPGGAFPMTVTVHWKVAWTTTTGLAGQTPDLTASSSLSLRVSEIQALVTDVRP